MTLSKEAIGKNVIRARAMKSNELGVKYTQKMLANDTKISQGYLSDIENGRSFPSRDASIAISNACGVSLDFIMGTEKSTKRDHAEKLEKIKMLLGDLLDIVFLPVFMDINHAETFLSENDIETYLPSPAEYDAEHHFFLKIKDTRFDEWGININDLVLIRRQPIVQDGQTAVIHSAEKGLAIIKYKEHAWAQLSTEGYQIIGIAVSLTKSLL